MDNRTLEIVLKARDDASQTIQQVGNTSDSLSEKFKRNVKEAGVFATGMLASFGLLTKSALENAASYEQNRIAFESMLGSADNARKLLSQISDFAQKTPFELPQVVEGARRLLAYNVEAEKIIPTFQMLGDISAAVGTDKLPQLIVAFGQVKAATKLTGAELRQFSEAGVPLLQALVNQANATGGTLTKVGGLSKSAAKKMGSLTEKLVDQEFRLKLLNEAGKQSTIGYKTLERNIEKNKQKLTEFGSVGEASYVRVKQTAEQMIEAIGDGSVKFEDVEKALKGMTGEGGKFFNMMDKQSKSFNGIMSNISDAFGKFVRELVGINDQGDIREGSLFAHLKVGAERFLVVLEQIRPAATSFVTTLSQNKNVIIAIAGALGGMLVLALTALVMAFGPALAIMTGFMAAGAGLAVVIANLDTVLRQLGPTLAIVTANLFILIGGFQGLWAIMVAHPIGAIITAISLLTLGIGYLVTQTDTFKTKNDLLADSMNRVKNAADEVTNAQERLKDIYVQLEGSELAVARAQKNLDSVVKQYGLTSLEAKEAQHQLNQAHRQQERAINDAKKALQDADAVEKTYQKEVAGYHQSVNRTKSTWESVTGAIGGAINKMREWYEGGKQYGLTFDRPQLGLPRIFHDGGWVNGTGPAVVQDGEFVLSREMLAGRQPVPANVPMPSRDVTINLGGVMVGSSGDVDALAHRLGFYFQTAGNL